MKTTIFNLNKWVLASALLGLLILPFSFTSCKEDIDDSAYAVADKDQIMELLQADTATYSDFIGILGRVRLGTSSNASLLSSVLASRGHYTVFAPTNEAVRAYVKDNYDTTDYTALTDDQLKRIAYNCIIDCGTDEAYELTDVQAYVDGTLPLSNLSDRRLQISTDDNSDVYINADAKILGSNVEASNGMLFTVDHVIMPSQLNVAELVQAAPNMRVMGKLLEVTGWADQLAEDVDAPNEYLTTYANEVGTAVKFPNVADFTFMETRYIKYTAFVETDSVLFNDWGIPLPEYDETTETIANWDAIMSALESKCEEVLGVNADHGDYTSEENAVNRFIAYHLLEGGMPLEGMVHHFNEYNYKPGSDYKNPQTQYYSVNIWDYYTTRGKYRGLLKITQLPDLDNRTADLDCGDHPYFLNRISKYDDSFDGSYKELSRTDNTPTNGLNIQVSSTNSSSTEGNNGANGYYYPINHVLVYNAQTQAALGSERIRMDFTTMLPELLSNDVRITKTYKYFPIDYFENVTKVNEATKIGYLHMPSTTGAWKDYQGDEFLFFGKFDFVIKLPPVPASGTYELRMGVSNNYLRSFVQIYGGTSPESTVPLGLPLDQRLVQGLSAHDGSADDINPEFPWVWDDYYDYDEELCRENDRDLRNKGYMKGPKYAQCLSGSNGNTLRDHIEKNAQYGPATRRILTTRYFDKDETYYLRFKCAVEYSAAQFFVDYFEYCPTSVYNGTTSEDVW